MSKLRQLLKSTRNKIYENLYPAPIHIELKKAIFSFTFDDVPVTAMSNGARILEKHDALGTFYVAMGMSDVELNKERRKFLSDEDLKLLSNKGHDIQCHTYSHYSTKSHSPGILSQDCEKNNLRLKEILPGKKIEHFAYPFGQVSLQAKKRLNSRFKTMRTVEHGINFGKTDFSYLKGVSLCDIDFNRTAIQQAIQLAIKKNAWVVFFTHEICESPSDWGTKTEDFEWVVKQCSKSNGEIRSVSAAFEEITLNSTDI